MKPQANETKALIFGCSFNLRLFQGTNPFGKWRPSKPLSLFSFPAACQAPLAGLALRGISKRQLYFSREKGNLYFEVKKEALVPLNTSLKQEDIVVSVIFFFFTISLFLSTCPHQNCPTKSTNTVTLITRIDFFFHH